MPNIPDYLFKDDREEAEFDKQLEEELKNYIESVNYNSEFKVVTPNKDTVLDIDIIEYLDMKKNYETYLGVINFWGGFMTYDHLVMALASKYKRTTVFTTLNEMVDKGYLRKESLGRFNYVILSKKAQVFIKYIPKANHISKPNHVKMLSNLLLLDFVINDYRIKGRNGLPGNAIESSLNSGAYAFDSYFRDHVFTLYMNMSRRSELGLWQELCNYAKYNENEMYKVFDDHCIPEFVNPIEAIKKQTEILCDSMECEDGKKKKRETYDILSKLMSRKIYIIDNWADDTNCRNVEILILDIDKENRWFKSAIEDVDHLFATLYFNAARVVEDKVIKLNFTIVTENPNKVKIIQKYLDRVIKEMRDKTDKYIKKCIIRWNKEDDGIKAHYSIDSIYGAGGRHVVYNEKNKKELSRAKGEYSGRFDPEYLFYVNEIKVKSFNTVRFFETRADNVDIITKDTFKIIDLKDIDNTSEKSLKTMSYEEEDEVIYDIDEEFEDDEYVIYDIPDDEDEDDEYVIYDIPDDEND